MSCIRIARSKKLTRSILAHGAQLPIGSIHRLQPPSTQQPDTQAGCRHGCARTQVQTMIVNGLFGDSGLESLDNVIAFDAAVTNFLEKGLAEAPDDTPMHY